VLIILTLTDFSPEITDFNDMNFYNLTINPNFMNKILHDVVFRAGPGTPRELNQFNFTINFKL
jgi:hypothetical protein